MATMLLLLCALPGTQPALTGGIKISGDRSLEPKAFEIFNSFYFFPSTHLAAENALLQVKTGIISADDILIVRKIDGRGGADGARIRLVEIDKSQLDVDVANCKSKI